MDSDYKTLLVRDSRLEKISDKIDLPIYSGSPSTTFASVKANGNPSATSVQFSAQVPNSNVAIDRRMYVEMECVFVYTVGNKDRAGGDLINGKAVFEYAGTDAFQSFPLNRMINSAILRLDNATFSSNVSDNLPALLRMLTNEELSEYQNGTPTYLDNYKDFFDASGDGGASNGPLQGYVRKGFAEFLYPRGCHPVSIDVVHAGGGNAGGTVVSATANANELFTITMTATFREPLFMSPCIWGNPDKGNNSALLGVRNIDLNLSLGTVERAFSSSANISTSDRYSFKLTQVKNATLYLTYMSIPSSLKLPPKFVLPYIQYTRYKTADQQIGDVNTSAIVTTNNIQLQSVPQLILVYARNPENNAKVQQTDSFYPIESVSVNFANKSGLLSSATKYQLYKLSKDNGVQLDWYSWSGLAKKYLAAADDITGGRGVDVKTVGSVLCINPAKDLSIDEVLTGGSGGSFNLQLGVNILNNSAVNKPYVDVCVLICENGYIKNVNGSTTSSIAVLSADEVVNALSGASMSDHNDLSRDMVALGSGMKPVHRIGGSRSAGARSGGRMSAFV